MMNEVENGVASIGLVPVLNVKDMNKSVKFYSELGFSIQQEYRDDDELLWVWLRSGKTELMLNAHDSIQPEERSQRPAYGDVVLYLYFDDAHMVHQRLKQTGWPVSDIYRQMYGLDEFYVRDPSGYEIAIASVYQGAQQAPA